MKNNFRPTQGINGRCLATNDDNKDSNDNNDNNDNDNDNNNDNNFRPTQGINGRCLTTNDDNNALFTHMSQYICFTNTGVRPWQ